MRSKDQADAIRREMGQVRCDLDDDVERMVDNARTLSDWRYYVRKYPWSCLAAATAIGFFAVPKRLELISPDVETLLKLAGKQRLVVEPQPRGVAKSGFAGSLLSLLGNLAIRSAITVAGQQVGKLMGEKAAQDEDARERTGAMS